MEGKWRCADLEAVRRRAVASGAAEAGLLHQCDLFFPAAGARLKLRSCEGAPGGELIAYRRPDGAEARISDYHRAPVAEPDALAAVLRYALGEGVTVRKRRRLLLHGRTRIHLDEVEGLGGFVELETVLADDCEAAGRREFAALVDTLDLAALEPATVAYADLLAG